MANRSHIYACDDVPGNKGFTARGLSEYNWAIPLAHKLMVGTRPRITRSAIWDGELGILADREGAFERTIGLFDKLAEGELPDRAEFDEELAQLKEFLASAPPSKYVLLEAGEILDIMDGELPALLEALHAELVPLAARAERAIAGGEREWIEELRASWAEQARPGYWSDVLYYSLEDRSEPAPAKPARPPAKKPVKKSAKKPVKKSAKKPVKKSVKKKPVKKPATKPATKPTTKPTKKRR